MDQDRDQQGEPSDAQPERPAGQTEAVAAAGGEAVTLSYAEYEELKALAQERDEYLRRLQRAVADYQNLQKRVDRFQDSARHAALRSLADDILPVADSLARALEAAQQTEGAEAIVQGLHLVEREFYGALAGFGIHPVEAVGQKFDPHYHEAAVQQPVGDVPPNTVVRELKKGFMLGDIVVRPSQVVVSAAPPVQDDAGSDGAPGENGTVDSQGADA